jgi:hypothetical protein
MMLDAVVYMGKQWRLKGVPNTPLGSVHRNRQFLFDPTVKILNLLAPPRTM